MDNESLHDFPQLRVLIQPGKAIRVRPYLGGEGRVISHREYPDGLLGHEVIQYGRSQVGEFVRRWMVFPGLRTANDAPYGILLFAPTYLVLKGKQRPSDPDEFVRKVELVDNLHDLWDEIVDVQFKHDDAWEEYFQ